MNVGELKELLDEFGDHLDVRVVYETDKDDRVFQIEDVVFSGGGNVVLEVSKFVSGGAK